MEDRGSQGMAPSLKECVYNKVEAIKKHPQDDREQHRRARAKGVCLVQKMCPGSPGLGCNGTTCVDEG